MIPRKYDDGFSILVGGGFARPMLRPERLAMRESPPDRWDNTVSRLFEPPYFFGPMWWKTDKEIRESIVRAVIGDTVDERKAFDQVKRDITMLHQHPGLLRLSCQDCRAFATNPDTGAILTTRSGAPLLRKLPVACETGSCPKGHWQDPYTVSTLGKKVWEHYWQMRAARASTECPIMMRNWAFIEWVVFHGRRPELNPIAS
jgi:hypothetical protein